MGADVQADERAALAYFRDWLNGPDGQGRQCPLNWAGLRTPIEDAYTAGLAAARAESAALRAALEEIVGDPNKRTVYDLPWAIASNALAARTPAPVEATAAAVLWGPPQPNPIRPGAAIRYGMANGANVEATADE